LPCNTSTIKHAPDVSGTPGADDENDIEPEESICVKNKTTRQWCRQASDASADVSRCHAARKLMQVRQRLRAARAPSEASADDTQDTQPAETEPVEDASLESPALASPGWNFTSPTRPPQADPANNTSQSPEPPLSTRQSSPAPPPPDKVAKATADHSEEAKLFECDWISAAGTQLNDVYEDGQEVCPWSPVTTPTLS
jgi:hypothetical protein